MVHCFFIGVNNFWLGLKIVHRTILQTCGLSPSDGEISPFWFNSPGLLVNANNLPVFEKISGASRQESLSQIIRNTPLAFCFVTIFFFNFLLKEVLQEIIVWKIAQWSIGNNHLFSDG